LWKLLGPFSTFKAFLAAVLSVISDLPASVVNHGNSTLLPFQLNSMPLGIGRQQLEMAANSCTNMCKRDLRHIRVIFLLFDASTPSCVCSWRFKVG
jgi:hypothetical protein